MNEHQDQAHSRSRIRIRTIGYVGLAVATVVALILTWQSFIYRGLFAALAEWQFRNWDRMWPFATIATLTGLVLLPFVLLVAWRLRRRRRLLGRADRLTVVARDTLIASVLKILAIVFGIIAAILVVYAFSIGTLADKPVANLSLEESATPEAGLVNARGTVMTDRVGYYRERLVFFGRDLYVAPLANSGTDNSIRFFVEIPQQDLERPERREFEGFLRRSAVPGGLERLYQNAGYEISRPTYIIFQDLSSARWPFFSAAGDLGLIALLLAICWLVLRRHIGKIKDADPEQS